MARRGREWGSVDHWKMLLRRTMVLSKAKRAVGNATSAHTFSTARTLSLGPPLTPTLRKGNTEEYYKVTPAVRKWDCWRQESI